MTILYRAVLTLAVGLGWASAGCGGGEQSRIQDTVRTYLNAVADADGKAACDQLTGEARRALVDSVRSQVPELNVTTCQSAITTVAANLGADETSSLKNVDFASVQIREDSATARPKGATGKAELRKINGEWYISGGLTP